MSGSGGQVPSLGDARCLAAGVYCRMSSIGLFQSEVTNSALWLALSPCSPYPAACVFATRYGGTSDA